MDLSLYLEVDFGKAVTSTLQTNASPNPDLAITKDEHIHYANPSLHTT